MALQTERQFIYLYDLPKSVVTSVKIATVIKEKTGYDLTEPVQQRDCRPHPLTGLPSPFCQGIIKVDPAEWKKVADAIKYFNITDGTNDKVWQCRALPFDRDLLGAQRNNTNTSLNVFLKDIPQDISAEELDKSFAEKFGPVKSAKISRSWAEIIVEEPLLDEDGKQLLDNNRNPLVRRVKKYDESQPPTSNGYGFVCFQNPADTEKAVIQGVIDGKIKAIKYQPKDPRDIRKVYNNIYVKNFDPTWNEEDLSKVFSQYGDIISLIRQTKKNKEGETKPFAFICFDRKNDKAHGPAAADNAVQQLHEKEIDGFKLYVQPAIPKTQRQAQVHREQLRFKNSKKKCNLFVKGFPAEYKAENLAQLFQEFGEIESIKIMPPKDNVPSQRAFICFKSPDSASRARMTLHGQTIEGKQIYVANYELPETRRKIQAEAKDKADFMNHRKQNPMAFDPSIIQRPDTMKVIEQIMYVLQNQMRYGNRPQGGYQNNRQQQPYNNNGGQPRAYSNNRPPYNNNNNGGQYPQRQPRAQPILAQVPAMVGQQMIAQPAPQVIINTDGRLGPSAPLPHLDPFVAQYNLKGFGFLPVVVPENPNLKQFVGEFIYEFVEGLIGEERAPKVTGMLIDLPIEEIKGYLYDYFKLRQKIEEALQILAQTGQQ